jgi:hypothetical protein
MLADHQSAAGGAAVWRRYLLGALGVVLVTGVAALIALCWPPPGDRLGPASYTRIREGMTEAEVFAIVGLPPGDYYTGPPRSGGIGSGPFTHRDRQWGLNTDDFRTKKWFGNRYMLEITFEDGRVVGCCLSTVFPARRPFGGRSVSTPQRGE